MKYIDSNHNGFSTRNNVIRSMDIPHSADYEIALEHYNQCWFKSTRKQYLNEALKLVMNEAMFWPKRAISEMLDEIYIYNTEYDDKTLAKDIDLLKSQLQIWGSNRVHNITNSQIQKAVRSFEKKYPKYECPDSFKFYWTNNGAYVTLMYGVKYEGITFPNMTQEETISKLKMMAVQVLSEHNHDFDDRLFQLCYYLYKNRCINIMQYGTSNDFDK